MVWFTMGTLRERAAAIQAFGVRLHGAGDSIQGASVGHTACSRRPLGAERVLQKEARRL
jgi:hypothetical protein